MWFGKSLIHPRRRRRLKDNIYKCDRFNNSIGCYMTYTEISAWINYILTEIMNGNYSNQDFHPDAQLRLYDLFDHTTQFKCLHNPVWHWSTMTSPVPTYTRKCSFTTGCLFAIGRCFNEFSILIHEYYIRYYIYRGLWLWHLSGCKTRLWGLSKLSPSVTNKVLEFHSHWYVFELPDLVW